ncbi:hypothetical protein Lfu02_28740 [Longispora fulva]|uniref:Uncharacterized protein n=1 Tax=Longispora fulva TaxID=619741 RepID=A0A8J7KL79_9ACTN|nr:hypothetical protein [Longispora fulva]MBG6139009.1 hypothetical protein [Longispora fulva]GIG58502.1 hypothetical protein Lfu02_28740 [Longispora fulva]
MGGVRSVRIREDLCGVRNAAAAHAHRPEMRELAHDIDRSLALTA